ncbi:MAG: hypothetical protein QXV55_00330 [Acidilobaceae archaeon]
MKQKQKKPKDQLFIILIMLKVALTLVLAVAGALLAVLGSEVRSSVLIVVGFIIIAFSPVLSYVLIHMILVKRLYGL